jgi:hypothetical protein
VGAIRISTAPCVKEVNLLSVRISGWQLHLFAKTFVEGVEVLDF